MNVVFDRKDFTLCKVPVPKGYPQSQTHCGIAYNKGRYYLTTSPYPNPIRPQWLKYLAAVLKKLTFGKINYLYLGEDFENPMLYEAVKCAAKQIPIVFKLVKGSPLMQKPNDIYGTGSFCSDPDLSINDGKICVLNRTTVRGISEQKGETIVHLIKGNVENGRFVVEKNEPMFHEGYKSPCMTKLESMYYYFCLDTNSYNTGEPCKALLVKESADMIHWSEAKSICMENGAYEPWHMSVFKHGGKLYAIIACVRSGESHRCWQMFGEFDETLSSLKIYQTPLNDFRSYRGSAMVRDDGEFVLYNTTVREKIRGGRSVDGREVVMAHMPFEELLIKLRKDVQICQSKV